MPSPGPGHPQTMAAPWTASRSRARAVAAHRWKMYGVSDDGDGDEGESDERRRGRAASRPRSRRAGEAARCQLTGDRSRHSAGKGDGAHALADRAQQHFTAGDRGEHEVAGVAGLQRDRPTVAAAAQAEGNGGDGDETDDGGAVFDDVGELARRRRLVGDEVAQPHHGKAAEESGEVHPIGDLEPLELTETAGTPGASHLAQRQRRARHLG